MERNVVFFTGGGGFIGRNILRHYLERDDCELYLLEHGPFASRLRAFLDERVSDPDRRKRFRVVEGDITSPGLGLKPETAASLQESMTHAYHLAAVYDLSVPKDFAFRINVDGTRNVLDFLGKAKNLQRFGYASTCAVAGDFHGTFGEDDFNKGQGFKNNYDRTKFEAEKLVRERRDAIPTVIIRPPYVVGHSQTGEFEKIDGPYYGLVAISRNMHLIIPDSGPVKCHAAPVDFVADAFYHLLHDENAAGSVYLLADPNPLTWNEYMALACERWPKFKPLLRLPPALLDPFFRFGPLGFLTGIPYQGFKYTSCPVEYDVAKTTAALAKHGIVCPPIADYIDVMIRYFREHHADAGVRKGRIYQSLSD